MNTKLQTLPSPPTCQCCFQQTGSVLLLPGGDCCSSFTFSVASFFIEATLVSPAASRLRKRRWRERSRGRAFIYRAELCAPNRELRTGLHCGELHSFKG
ncbi:unnamed protein product [Calypogeia fissa]